MTEHTDAYVNVSTTSLRQSPTPLFSLSLSLSLSAGAKPLKATLLSPINLIMEIGTVVSS